jgi:hypothetical protein
MIATKQRHRRHQGPAAHVATRLVCGSCRQPFVLTGQRAWRAALGRAQGVGAICDPCANRAAARAE